MHQLVHDKRRPGHVAAVLHQGNEQVQDHDVRQEHQYAADPGDHAVDQQVLQPAVPEEGADEIPETPDEPFDPVHRVLSERKGRPEHHVQQHDENRECRPPVREGPAGTVFHVAVVGFGQGALDEGVFRIDDGRFGVGAEEFPDARGFFVAGGGEFRGIGQGGEQFFDVAVVFQVFDRQVAGRIAGAEALIRPDQVAEAVYAAFQLGAVVDVDMAGELRIGLFIDPDHRIEKFGDPFTAAADRRAHRDAEQVAELGGVEPVALRPQFVVHVQRHDDAEVHVDELRGEIEVAFDIRGVDDVDDDVRHGFDQVLAHIEFFGAVGGKRIGAGQVDKGDVVVLVAEAALLGIDGHAAVVADMLMAAGSHVEKGGLPAVGIADEGDTQGVTALVRNMGECFFEQLMLLTGRCFQSLQMLIGHEGVTSFRLADHLDIGGLLAAEGQLVTDDFVFDRIAERGIQHDADRLAADKAHLDQTLAETAVSVDADDDAPFPRLQIR